MSSMNLIEEIFRSLASRVPPLRPQSAWSKEISSSIDEVCESKLLAAAFFLWNDELEKAHCIVQKLDSDAAKLIHAIHHRREGDFYNARSWLNQISQHPVGDKIREVFPDWEPLQYVDECQNEANSQNYARVPRPEAVEPWRNFSNKMATPFCEFSFKTGFRKCKSIFCGWIPHGQSPWGIHKEIQRLEEIQSFELRAVAEYVMKGS